MSQQHQHAAARHDHERQVRYVRQSLWRRPPAGTRERMPRGR